MFIKYFQNASKAETYSECFETDEDTDTKRSKTKEKSKASHSSLERKKNEQRTSQAESEERQLCERDERSKTSPLSEDDNMSSPNQQDDFILPVMASTMVSSLNSLLRLNEQRGLFLSQG
jgi:hypothetical protein